MPKANRLFPARLDFYVKPEVRMQVIAIAYHLGTRGKHAAACRRLIQLGIKSYLDALTPKQRKEYDFILQRIRLLEDPKVWDEPKQGIPRGEPE